MIIDPHRNIKNVIFMTTSTTILAQHPNLILRLSQYMQDTHPPYVHICNASTLPGHISKNSSFGKKGYDTIDSPPQWAHFLPPVPVNRLLRLATTSHGVHPDRGTPVPTHMYARTTSLVPPPKNPRIATNPGRTDRERYPSSDLNLGSCCCGCLPVCQYCLDTDPLLSSLCYTRCVLLTQLFLVFFFLKMII